MQRSSSKFGIMTASHHTTLWVQCRFAPPEMCPCASKFMGFELCSLVLERVQQLAEEICELSAAPSSAASVDPQPSYRADRAGDEKRWPKPAAKTGGQPGGWARGGRARPHLPPPLRPPNDPPPQTPPPAPNSAPFRHIPSFRPPSAPILLLPHSPPYPKPLHLFHLRGARA